MPRRRARQMPPVQDRRDTAWNITCSTKRNMYALKVLGCLYVVRRRIFEISCSKGLGRCPRRLVSFLRACILRALSLRRDPRCMYGRSVSAEPAGPNALHGCWVALWLDNAS